MFEELQNINTIDELEQFLRSQYYTIDSCKIFEDLKEYPQLRQFAQNICKWMQTYTINMYPADNLFDMLINCICADCIMEILYQYDQVKLERDYQTEHSNDDTREKNMDRTNRDAFARWLYSKKDDNYYSLVKSACKCNPIAVVKVSAKEGHNKRENKKTTVATYRYSDLEHDFLQANMTLYNYVISTEINDMGYMLHPASFLPLIPEHCIFSYCVEKYWNFYEVICEDNAAMEEDGDWYTNEEQIKDNFQSINYSKLLIMLIKNTAVTTTIHDIYSSECGLSDCIEDLLTLVENFGMISDNRMQRILYGISNKLTQANKKPIFSPTFADIKSAHDSVNIIKNELCRLLDTDARALGELLTRKNTPYNPYQQYNQHLLSCVSTPSYRFDLWKRLNNMTKVDCNDAIEKFSTALSISCNGGSPLELFKELTDFLVPRGAKDNNVVSESTYSWYDGIEALHHSLSVKPYNFVNAPCTKMFFIHLERKLWPELQKEPLPSNYFIADYYIGSIAIAKIVQLYCNQFKEGKINWEQISWPWADKILNDIYNSTASDKDILPLLQQTMDWFYSPEVIMQAMYTCQMRPTLENNLHIAFNYRLGISEPYSILEKLQNIVKSANRNYSDNKDLSKMKKPSEIYMVSNKFWKNIKQPLEETYTGKIFKREYAQFLSTNFVMKQRVDK